MPDNSPIPVNVRALVIVQNSLPPLLPSGSNLLEAGDCVRGYVGFEKPEDQEPEFVLYENVGRSGLSEPVKWALE